MASIRELAQIGVFRLKGAPVFVTTGQLVESNRIFGATFMDEKCVWLFPAFNPFMEDVLSDIEVVFPEVPLTDAAQAHIEEERARCLPEDFTFQTNPYAHQREGLDFLAHNMRCALFFDCGLGKTKTVIDLLRHEKKKALILAPATALRVWMREFERHAKGEIRPLLLKPGSKKQRTILLEQADDYDVLLLSYDSTHRYLDSIVANFKYSIIIADESHYMGSYRSKRTKAALLLADQAARRIIMSGTPTLGNPMHLFGQLSFLGRYVPAKTFHTFQKHFLIRKPLPFNSNIQAVYGYKNLDLLNNKLQKIALRRTAAECLDLPPRTIQDLEFKVSGEQKRVYNDVVKSHLSELGGDVIVPPEHAITRVQKLLQILSGFYIQPLPIICDGCEHLKNCVDDDIKPYTRKCLVQPTRPAPEITRFRSPGKLEALKELLQSLLEDKTHKVLVWCHFTEELDMVQALLEKNGWAYYRIDGSNSSSAEALSHAFNTEDKIKVWLAQISTGISLTLNRAAYTVYYGINFSLGSYLQSLDRNYRIGQKQPTFTYRFTYPNSLLETVWGALEAKIDLSEVLTTRIQCVVCPNVLPCMADGIEAFEEGCIYSSRKIRVVARPRLLR